MKHYQVRFLPDHITVTIHQGATLLEAAEQAGIILSSPCGGAGRCGRCKACLLPSKKEVLACQYTIEHDIDVQIPDASRFFRQKILEHGMGQKIPADPAVRKCFISNPPAAALQIAEHITNNLGLPTKLDDRLDPAAIQIPPAAAPEGSTAVLLSRPETGAKPGKSHWHMIAVEKGDTTERVFGAAVDIGTTTVLVRLVNLQTLETVAVVSAANPQGRYGHDVISRIAYAETEEGLNTLHRAVIACLNTLLDEAARAAGIDTSSIYEAVIVGNTTMNHLLLKYPVHQLGQAPYQAWSTQPVNSRAAALGIRIHPNANIYTPANIAGFVGSDTLAAALAGGLDNTDAFTLLVDIGTNGELVLGTQDRLLSASCAAGPALEGAGITFGSRAQAGAIERVIYDQADIDVDVIGPAQPATICGSGLIDAVAVLLEAGIIDETGRFSDPDELPLLPPKMKKRLTRRGNEPAFRLAGAQNDPTAVVLTQKDVRQVQLAKAAIQAGILLLLNEYRRRPDHIQQVFLAGAFGNYIRRENAVRIGLLPDIPLEKIHFVGNAAGAGAQMLLINRRTRKLSEPFARKLQYLEIAHQTEFQDIYSDCLLFPDQ